MFGFKKRTASKEETINQPTVADKSTTDDELSEEMLDHACGYTPANYTAPAGLFRKPVPEDLI